MRLRMEFASLRATTVGEYAKRFVIGGLITVGASLIANHWGAVIGGLFLAFPGIFRAGVSLVEKHKIEREEKDGKRGVMSARGEASAEAAGGSAGALGLAAFALVLWKGLPGHGLTPVLVVAGVVWAAVGWAAWWLREKM